MPADISEKAGPVDDVLREVTKIKPIAVDAAKDRAQSAVHTLKHERNAAEDAIKESKYTVKLSPFQAVGIVFAAGLLTGSFLNSIRSSRR